MSPEIVTAGLVWIVDPLDGTTNFLHNFPAFAVSIAAAVDGILQAGVVLHVPLNRLSQATATAEHGRTGTGCRSPESPIPPISLIGTGVPFKDSPASTSTWPSWENHPRRVPGCDGQDQLPRPDRCSRWSLRRLLGAAPGAVGCGRGDITGA